MDNTIYNLPDPPDRPEVSPRLITPATAQETRALFSRLGLSMLVLSLVTYASQYGLNYLLDILIPGFAGSWWRVWVLSIVPLYGLGLPAMLLSLRGVPKVAHNADYLDPVGKTLQEKPRFTVGHFIILLVIGLGCMYTGSMLGQTVMGILSTLTGYPYKDQLQGVIESSPQWIVFLSTCIVAPLGEEFIFRKLLIDRSRRFGDTVSILISGFFFGLFHGNLFQFFYAFLLGMVLAYIYTRTGNLWWCVGMHALVNFLGSIVVPALAGLMPTDPQAILTPLQTLITLFLLLWTYGLITAGMILLLVFRKNRRLSPGTTPLLLADRATHVLLNPGMLGNFIAMSLMMILNLIPAA